MLWGVLSPTQNAMLGNAIASVRQKRADDFERTAANFKMEPVKGKTKPKGKGAGGTSKTKVPASTITPYLTADDIMRVADAEEAASSTENDATLGLITAGANAKVSAGDIERDRVRGVSGANDDAAARGIFRSGIRAGNVGKVLSAAGRAQAGVNDQLAMAGAQANSQIMGARNRLARHAQGMVAKAAENAAALPVDPYSNGPARGANVKGAVTRRRRGAR